ncbi:MAG: PA0069 family radical SAM protein, partial [Longimicrobiales bacterium]
DHFDTWLSRHFPDRKDRILKRIKAMRGGSLNDSAFFSRAKGKGPYALGVGQLFRVAARKLGLDKPPPSLNIDHFRRDGGVQSDLFR